MAKPSREQDILKLFYNLPTKHWHFKDIKRLVPIADNKISRWLKTFQKQKLIKKVKPKKKMPFYISNYQNPEYQNQKKLFALKKFNEAGFLTHIMKLDDIKTAIIFGSFSRWDWHKDSDIDLFILGDDSNFKQAKFEQILNRNIQLFTYKNTKDLKNISKGMLKNFLKGNLIKGELDFIEVKTIA